MFIESRPAEVHTRTQCANDGVQWDGNLTTAEGLVTGAISGLCVLLWMARVACRSMIYNGREDS